MRILTEAQRQEIRAAMAGLSGSDAQKAALELSRSFGSSKKTIYRVSRATRIIRSRSTKGTIRIPIDKEILEDMIAMKVTLDIATTDTVDIFEKNGVIPSGLIRPAWLNGQLRARGYSSKELAVDRRPYRRFEAGEPGEVFQIDATLSEQWYLDNDGSIDLESRASRNKNRPGNKKTRLHIITAIDDHSRCVYAEFTTGVTVDHWLQFMFNCFRKKGDPRFIFHGIPRIVYLDNDSVTKNEKFVRAQNALGIKIKKHKPTRKTDKFSNARSKGKIERQIGYLVQKQRITRRDKFSNLEEGNRFLFEVCLEKNSKIHAGTGEIPFRRWLRIRPEMLVQCEDEELYNALYRDRYECHVYGDLTIRLNGKIWQLPRETDFYGMIEQRVEVYVHPLEPDQISIVWQGQEYEIELAKPELRAFSDGPIRFPKTEKDKELEALEARDLSHYKLWGFDQGPDKNVAYLPVKKGVEFDTSGLKPEPAKMRRIDAMMKIAGELGRPLSGEENTHLTALFEKWVTDQEIDEAMKQLIVGTRRAVSLR